MYKSIKDAGLASKKGLLLCNGVSTDRFLNKCEVSAEEQKNLGISEDDMVFLLLGWSPVRKGVDIFLRAAIELSSQYKHCRFLVVGTSETREFVAQSMRKSSLADKFIRGIGPAENFSDLLKLTDVFVTASRSEGFSYAVLEAMTAGKVVLSSDIAGVRETNGRSDGVWLFPTEDWKMLSGLMKKITQLQQEERRLLGRANSQYVIENHSLDQWSKAMGEVYKGLITRCV